MAAASRSCTARITGTPTRKTRWSVLWRKRYIPVSYTHLDVYKRQVLDYLRFPKAPGPLKKYTYNLADLAIFLGAVLMVLRRRRQ